MPSKPSWEGNDMVKVWMLYLFMNYVNAGGPMVIDNIASYSECRRVQLVMAQRPYYNDSQCIEVWKVKLGGG
jgi:hypothetical protein